jgi:hypothetical protein
MKFRILSTALACSMIGGALTVIGCDSQAPADPKADAVRQEAFEKQNEALKGVRAPQGKVPKSVKGGRGATPPPAAEVKE